MTDAKEEFPETPSGEPIGTEAVEDDEHEDDTRPDDPRD